MAEREQVEQEIVEILAQGIHQRFSELINLIAVATPMQVVRWATLSETTFEDLGAIEKICYLSIAMVELQKIRPLLPGYVQAFRPEENPTV